MKKNVVKTAIRNILIMAILVFITFKYLIEGFSKKEVIHAIQNANHFLLFVGILLSICYILFEALNTKFLLQTYGYKPSLLRCASYSFTGYFFSGLTPSSTGGQPMQVFVMKTDGIKISHSTITLLIELCAFQFISVTLAVLGFIYNYDYILYSHQCQNKGIDVWIIYLGITSNILIFLFTFFVIFSKRFVLFVKKVAFFLIEKISFIKEKEKYKDIVSSGLDDYRKASIFIKSNKLLILQVTIIEGLQILSIYSIAYVVYRALGFNEFPWIQVLLLQALAYVSVSTMPLPGAIGISEKLFQFLFLILYPHRTITEALLLTRGINFYMLFCISAIMFTLLFGKTVIMKKIPKTENV